MGETAELTKIPLFVRPGTVVPLAPVVQHTQALPGGPLEVHVYSGADGSFKLVEDDGETTAYESQRTRETAFTWSETSHTLSWTVTDNVGGSLPRGFTEVYCTLFTAAGKAVSSASLALGTGG